MSAQTRIRAKSLRRALGGSSKAHEELQKACLTLLAFYKIPATALYTGPRVRPRAEGGFELRPNRSNVGISDVMACLPPAGRLILIECKTGRAQRTPEQIEKHNRFRAAGAHCITVRTIDELKQLLRPARGTCSVCGCTDARACQGGCFWVNDSHTLCSRCA